MQAAAGTSVVERVTARGETAKDSLLELAASLAERIHGSVPLLYGCGLTVPIAYRWKCQINENAKLPAFSHQLPEMNHNEIVGWGRAERGAYSAVLIEDDDQHPRERRRMELTAELVEPNARDVIRVTTVGESRTERLLWSVMLGDLLSLELAARAGADPTPVAVIEDLKDRLGRP